MQNNNNNSNNNKSFSILNQTYGLKNKLIITLDLLQIPLSLVNK